MDADLRKTQEEEAKKGRGLAHMEKEKGSV